MVKKVLQQIASQLHDNPSRSQLLLSSTQTGYPSSSSVLGTAAGGPIMGLTQLVVEYGEVMSVRVQIGLGLFIQLQEMKHLQKNFHFV